MPLEKLFGVTAAATFAAAMSFGSQALADAPTKVDPAKAQALAKQIEDSLANLGCDTQLQQEVAAIQSVIAASGVDPDTARAALKIDEAAKQPCAVAGDALASVDKTIELAQAKTPTPAAGGGPGGIGGPTVFVGGGGADYVTR